MKILPDMSPSLPSRHLTISLDWCAQAVLNLNNKLSQMINLSTITHFVKPVKLIISIDME